LLHSTRAGLQKTKDDLETRRDALLQEFHQINQDIDAVDVDLSQIHPTIEKLEGARQAYQLHKSLQPIPGSTDDDNQTIQEAEEIRLRAINVMQDSLGSL